MGYEKLMQNMKMILTGEELQRIHAGEEEGNAYVDLDLHGLSCKQATKLVRNIINVNRGDFNLNLIQWI